MKDKSGGPPTSRKVRVGRRGDSLGGSEEQVGKSGRESRGLHFRKAKNRTFQEKMGPLNAVIKPRKQ